MGDIENSGKYVPLEKIAVVSDKTPLPEVFSMLREKNQGGLLVQSTHPDTYKHFLAGNIVAQAALEAVKLEGEGWIRKTVLADILEKPEVKTTILDLNRNNLTDTISASDLKALPNSIFLVQQGAQTMGLLFNEDAALKIIQTSPPRYTCENGHNNPSIGDGYCDRCSKPLSVQ